MADFAELALGVDTSGLKSGERAQDSFGRSAERMEGKTTRATAAIGRGFSRMLPAITATVGALGAGLGVSAAIREAEKFETTMFRVEAVIRATNGAAGRSADQLRQQARDLALTTLESTEGILRAQQTLLTFRKVQGDVFDRAIVAAADMTAALGGDLNSATLQLAKALENPLEGISALSRSGTVFTQAQKDMVRAMVEAGQTAQAQSFILDELEAQYKGTAQAAAGGLAGAQDTLGQRFQELKLVIGDALLPVVETLVKYASNLVLVITQISEAVVWGFGKIENFKNAVFNLGLTSSQTSQAIDNISRSLADEDRAIQAVSASLPVGIQLSREAAVAKLNEARAIYQKIDAAREEARATIMMSEEYKKLQGEVNALQQAGDLLSGQGRSDRDRFTPNAAREGFERNLELLRGTIAAQKELLAAANIGSEAYGAAEENIRRLEAALSSTTGEIVTMGGSITELGDRAVIEFENVETAITAAGGALPKLREETTDAVRDMGQSVRNDLSRAWSRFVDRGFKDFRGFVSDVTSVFQKMLIDMVSAAARNRIIIPMTAAMSPTAASAGAGSAATGALAALGVFGSSVGTGLSVVGNGFMAGGIGGAMQASMGAITGGIGAGGAIGFGTALGAAIPIIGAVALVFGGLSKKIKELDSGVSVAVRGMEESAETFRKIQTSRFFGLSKKTSTQTSSDPDSPVLAAVDQVQAAVSSAAASLGYGAEVFNDFAYDFKLSLKGLSEQERAAKINEELAKMGDNMATLVPGMSSFNDLLSAANDAVARAGALGSTRFESQMLMAAARRGEIVTVGAGAGGTRGEDLIRLRSMDESSRTTAHNAARQAVIMERLLRIWERFEIDGIPRGPVVQ